MPFSAARPLMASRISRDMRATPRRGWNGGCRRTGSVDDAGVGGDRHLVVRRADQLAGERPAAVVALARAHARAAAEEAAEVVGLGQRALDCRARRPPARSARAPRPGRAVTRSQSSSVTPSGWSMKSRSVCPPTTSASSTSTSGSPTRAAPRSRLDGGCAQLSILLSDKKKAGERPLPVLSPAGLPAGPKMYLCRWIARCAEPVASGRPPARSGRGSAGSPCAPGRRQAARASGWRASRWRPSCCSERPRQNSAKSFVGRVLDDGLELLGGGLVALRAEQRPAERLADRGLVGLEVARPALSGHRGGVVVALLEQLRPRSGRARRRCPCPAKIRRGSGDRQRSQEPSRRRPRSLRRDGGAGGSAHTPRIRPSGPAPTASSRRRRGARRPIGLARVVAVARRGELAQVALARRPAVARREPVRASCPGRRARPLRRSARCSSSIAGRSDRRRGLAHAPRGERDPQRRRAAAERGRRRSRAAAAGSSRRRHRRSPSRRCRRRPGANGRPRTTAAVGVVGGVGAAAGPACVLGVCERAGESGGVGSQRDPADAGK